MASLAQKLHMLTGLPLLASRVLLAMAVLLFTWALLAAGMRLFKLYHIADLYVHHGFFTPVSCVIAVCVAGIAADGHVPS